MMQVDGWHRLECGARATIEAPLLVIDCTVKMLGVGAGLGMCCMWGGGVCGVGKAVGLC